MGKGKIVSMSTNAWTNAKGKGAGGRKVGIVGINVE